MTEDQLRLYDIIREHIAETGLSPTLAELAKATGRRHTGGLRAMVDNLVRSGLLIRTGDRRRNLQLPNDQNILGIATERLEAELRRRRRQPAWSREFRESIGRAEPPLGPPAMSATSNWGQPRKRGFFRG